MKVEHITLGGNAVIRDTADIFDTTKRFFSTIDMAYESKLYTIPKLPFKIKVSAAPEGALFDIQIGGNPSIVNVCCFADISSKEMIKYVDQMCSMFRMFIPSLSVTEPVTPQWLYSVIMDPKISPEVAKLAGEVELYIYERLYVAWKKKNQK
ncbi:hypothetical protein [Belliella pelovolcani]|uniref:hypothetical protein n=1 Tax=Belliella pelovolcani TaxID=529505 RepID=UPI00391B344A